MSVVSTQAKVTGNPNLVLATSVVAGSKVIIGEDGKPLSQLVFDGQKNVVKTLVDDIINDVMWNPWVNEEYRWCRKFMMLPWETRAAMVCNGATPYYKPDNLLSAMLPQSNDQAALSAVLAAAAANTGISATRTRYVRLDRNIEGLSADFEIPANVTVISPYGYELKVAAGTAAVTIRLNNRSKLIGVKLDPKITIRYIGSVETDDTAVIGCESLSATLAGIFLVEAGAPGGGTHKNSVVALNKVTNRSYFFNRQHPVGFKTMGNDFEGVFGQSRGLFQYGGAGNEDAYNFIKGGIVGHGVLCRSDLSRGWYDNSVHNNHFELISEEGTTIDGMVNGYVEVGFSGTLDTCLCMAISGNAGGSPTVQLAKANLNGIVAARQALFVSTGPLAGKYLYFTGTSIVSAGSLYGFVLRDRTIAQEDLLALQGSYISIVVRADSNVYENNTYKDVRDPIKLYASGWNNVYIGNKNSRSMDLLPNGAPFFQYEISVTQVSGFSTEGTTSGGLCCSAPSGNMFINNDMTIGFRGLSYGSQANTEARMDAIPNFESGNRLSYGAVPTRANTNAWVSSKNFQNVTNTGAEFKPEFSRGAYERSASGNNKNAKYNSQEGIVISAGTMSYNIAHGLPAIPRRFNVTASNAIAASAPFYVTAGLAYITIVYTSAPTAGTGLFQIDAEVY